MTSPVELTLSADGLTDLVLTSEAGFCYVDLDLGFPVVRGVVDDRPDADGTDDTTVYFGSRAVSLSMVVQSGGGFTKQENLDRVVRFMSPRLRPELRYVLEEGGDERRVVLRAANVAAPLVAPHWLSAQRALLSWVAPDGVQELAVEETGLLEAAQDIEAGRVYPLTFNREYPESTPIGVATVTNAGNAPTYPTIECYGPCTNPRVENQTAGLQFELVDLTLAAGEFVEIDMRARTVLLNGLSNQSRYDRVDFATSMWWPLLPGDNTLRYYPETFDTGAEAIVRYRSAWL